MSSVFENIPAKWWGVVSNHFSSFPNDTIDFNHPYVRKPFQNIYPFIIIFYAIVILLGASTNIAMIAFIIRHRLFKDPTILFLGNEALSNVIKCIFLLPIILCHLLLHNWVFGYFMCFFLPMLQHFPFYVSTLTFLLIVLHRCQFLRRSNTNSKKYMIYSTLLVVASWIISVSAALPYAFSVHYFEVGFELSNAGICVVDLKKRIDVNRYATITMYVIPLLLILVFHLCLLITIKWQIETQQEETDTTISDSSEMETSFNSEAVIATITHTPVKARTPLSSFTVDEFDLSEEKRNQKYLFIIFLAFLFYSFPVNVLYFLKQIPSEDDDNRYYSIVSVTLMLLAFVPSCIMPALFTSWIAKRPIMNKTTFFWTDDKN